MSEAVYFHVTFEPHHKHSGKRTGRRITFHAEVPLDAAKAAGQSSDDEQLLTSIAMTGQRRQPGEDDMQISFHSIPVMARDLTTRQADAEKDGVRVWLLGADLE